MRRLLAVSFVCLALLAPPVTAAPDASLESVQEQFREVIKRLAPATVVCMPAGVRGRRAGFSSGVIVSPEGYVLSDSDAGLVIDVGAGGTPVRNWLSRIDVRVPQINAGSFLTYTASVIHRDATRDTSLLKIDRFPEGGFPFVEPGTSADVRVGDFAFAIGSNHLQESSSLPSLTSGLVSAIAPLAGSEGATPEWLYVSAGVNEGVNGGPLVNLEGRLVGTISLAVDADAVQPYQFLGKAVPMDRIREAYDGVPAAQPAFASLSVMGRAKTVGRALETAIHDAVIATRPGVVSLRVKRKTPLNGMQPLGRQNVDTPRYQGATSGTLISEAGEVITSLYNLTNVASLVEPTWERPPGAGVDDGLAAIESIEVHLSTGVSYAAVLTSYDPSLGIALLSPATPRESAVAGTLVPASTLKRGQFVVAVGDPHGTDREPTPIATLGILSKVHAENTSAPWRGLWQTDAAVTDATAGGPAMGIDGRLLGIQTLWLPVKHGRASGIGFVVPWSRIEARLPALRAGEIREAGFFGVRFQARGRPTLDSVVAGGAAGQGGLAAGDVITQFDGHPIETLGEAVSYIRSRWAGESLRVTVARGAEVFEVAVVLQPRTPSTD